MSGSITIFYHLPRVLDDIYTQQDFINFVLSMNYIELHKYCLLMSISYVVDFEHSHRVKEIYRPKKSLFFMAKVKTSL